MYMDGIFKEKNKITDSEGEKTKINKMQYVAVLSNMLFC